ncbi:MAG: nitronate monooxygenase, partial [Alphaproteobacteria bacterium]|nr:nitronate monooxygenase [Alphaproteobacteria bacterium]
IEKAGGDFSQVHEFVSGSNQEKAWTTGDIEAGMVTTGMAGGLVKDVPTCRELIATIVSDAEQIVNDRLAAIVGRQH